MKLPSRLSTLTPVTLLLALALAFPVLAARLLGSAERFAVLSGSSINATAASTVTGSVGAQGSVTGVIVATEVLPNNQAPVPQALLDLSAARATAAAHGGTLIASELGGQVLTPGIYHVAGTATLAPGSSLTLSGFGPYLINVDGGLDVGANAAVTLASGANPANVTWNVGGTVTLAADSDTLGAVMSAGEITTGSGSTLIGKLLSQSGPITLGGTAIIDNIAGAAPDFTPDSPSEGDRLTVCIGETLTFTVTGQDGDGDLVQLSLAGKPIGASQLPNQGGEDTAGPLGDDLLSTGTFPSSRFSWTPQPEDIGTRLLTYSLTDPDGNLTQLHVIVTATERPRFQRPPTPADGQTFTVCPGQPVSYTISASDPDALTAGSLTLSATGAPATLTHTPALPQSAALVAGTTASYTPTVAEQGQMFTVIYTAEDANGCAATTTVVIVVGQVPQFTDPTPEDGTVFTVCAGDPVNYSVRVADGDAADQVTLVASGLPGTARHFPTLPTSDNPAESQFSWTPTPDEAGTYVITYTATDSSPAACSSQTTVRIVVIRPLATSLDLTRTGTLAVDSQICFDAVVRDQCGRPLPGQTVVFQIVGTTGNDQRQVLTTDAAGLARLCFTPRFPGTDTVLVFVDLNGNLTRDAGEPQSTSNFTLTAPPGAVGVTVAGHGIVDPGTLSTRPTEKAIATVDATCTRTGAVRGTIGFTVRQPTFRLSNVKITGCSMFEGVEGRTAILFGTAKATRLGKVRFRVDVLDAGTPGVPNDRYLITFLTGTGATVSAGSNLRFIRQTGIRSTNDMLVRVGPALP
jgi:hypothetical protein